MQFTSLCRLACLVGLLLLAACNIVATPVPTPSRTPRPTITPAQAESATPLPAVTEPPGDSATPTRPPAATDTGRAATASPTATATLDPTATRSFVISRPTVAPLEVGNILVVRVERDSTRHNGAIAYLQIVYSGGRGPYQIFHDDTLQPDNPFGVLTDCDADMVHTIRITSRDGQVATKQYYVPTVTCPP